MGQSLSSLAFSPDSKNLATAITAEHVVKLWDLATGKESMVLNVATAPLAFSADGKMLATLDSFRPNIIQLWDATTGQMRTTFVENHAVASLAFSPDGKILAYGSGSGGVTLRDLATQEKLGGGHLGVVWSVAFSPDGKTLATASADRTAKLWDVSQLRVSPAEHERVTITGHTAAVISLAFSPDGKMLATGGDHGSRAEGDPGSRAKLWKWNGTGWQQHLTLRSTGTIWSVVFSPDGKTLATSGDGVKLWEVATGKELHYLKVPTRMFVVSVAFSPDGKTLAAGAQVEVPEHSLSAPADVNVWDVATGHELANLKGHFGNVYVAFAPDGQTLVTGGYESAVTKVWNTATWQPVAALPGIQKVLFALDGKPWAVQRFDEILKLPEWIPSDVDRVLAENQPTRLGVPVFARTSPIARDGKTVAAREWGNHLRLLDAMTGQERLILKGHIGNINAMAFSPDGTTLATAGDDKTVKLWRAATEQEVFVQSSVNLALEEFNLHIRQAATNTGKGRYQQAVVDFDKAVQLDTNSDQAHNNLAWLLATCPNPKVRNPNRAVELAKKAVELAPKEGNYWNTLGAAQYRAGDWKAAVDALKKSMGLRQGGNASDWFFLAMAHWQLGDKEQARKWYHQAVAWMDKNKPNDEELCRFRAEAAELLQLANPPKEGNVPNNEEKRSQSKK